MREPGRLIVWGGARALIRGRWGNKLTIVVLSSVTASEAIASCTQLGTEVLSQLPVIARTDPLNFVRHYDSAVEDARFVGATFLGHSRRQLFANAVIAASRVSA